MKIWNFLLDILKSICENGGNEAFSLYNEITSAIPEQGKSKMFLEHGAVIQLLSSNCLSYETNQKRYDDGFNLLKY
ncbi:CLUMA_CG003645, isoform A [Clunio marinus]|uniref:CLUMA_CG003645, isoform A n=1 Tax=Clunio marinus TaxID=568069 RepID=A0A1J1HQU7_9DIPT|nr:CLUMA_CG003645, isoform A [Clunio marinus]